MKTSKLTVLAVLLSTVMLNGCVAVVAGGAAVATKPRQTRVPSAPK